MIVILEANSFYTYYGRDKLKMKPMSIVDEETFEKEMDKIKEKYLATSSFIEILVRFKDDGRTLYHIF